MARVKNIKELPGGRVNVWLLTDEVDVRLNVSLGAYAEAGSPLGGEDIDSDKLSILEYSDSEHRAIKRALSILAFSDKNRRTLRQKLIDAGFDREIATRTVNECVALGYIDERRQLAILIRDEANRALRGPEYIKRKLLSKGYALADITEVTIELVEKGEVDFSLVFRKLAEKRSANDLESRRALMYKYGFRRSDAED